MLLSRFRSHSTLHTTLLCRRLAFLCARRLRTSFSAAARIRADRAAAAAAASAADTAMSSSASSSSSINSSSIARASVTGDDDRQQLPAAKRTKREATASVVIPPESAESKAARAHLPPALCKLEILGTWNKARTATLELPHGIVETPVFMPVGTQGTMKGLTSAQIAACGPQIMLSNTYHLGNRPGADVVAKMGGLHKFMNWDRNILTDSGGFQMVSLFDLAEITENGVLFESPVDRSLMMLTPEMSIHLQNQIGSDIMMALDDVCSSLTEDRNRVREAMHRTLRWIDRCIAAHRRPHVQNLFGIVQGGLDVELRDECLREMTARSQHLPGYAIGGLAGGEDKQEFWRVVHQCTSGLPDDKPRYLMGVGYPLDLVVCSALGVDMFDCVYPARTARFGVAFAPVPGGQLKLKQQQYRADMAVIDATCDCAVCCNGDVGEGRGYTRAYLHSVVAREAVGCSLVTIHNLRYLHNLMARLRAAIKANTFPAFLTEFLSTMFPNASAVPQWAVDALNAAGFTVTGRVATPARTTLPSSASVTVSSASTSQQV